MHYTAPQSLELHKVLTYLAGFAVSDAGQDAALTIKLESDEDALRLAGQLFEEGREFFIFSDERITAFPSLGSTLQYVASPTGFLDLDGLWALKQTLQQAMRFITIFTENPEHSKWPLWAKRSLEVHVPVKTVSGLGRCLADDGSLKDEASPDLLLIRSELRQLHRQCVRKVKDFSTEYNISHYLQDDFMTLSSDRYVLPLKANFKGRLQGIIHDYSQTGETCYFEPLFLVEINNRLQGLKREEREEEHKVMLFLTSLVREELLGIRSAYGLLVDLDLLQAKIALAGCYGGRILPLSPHYSVCLKDARHPLLALAASEEAFAAYTRMARRQYLEHGANGEEPEVGEFKRGGPVISSTIELQEGQQCLVISGGNAGGKTVCLKTLGLIALMGMCALPVPVGAGSVLPLWKHIFAFIGDEQSLDDHVSTFTAQITQLARIWPHLNSASMVILDEFGAGTDPSQGAALAQAVLDCMMDKGAYVVAATHFPALKAYALTVPRVRAASVLFDPKTKKPLFTLAYEQVGASQALDVAREHGLPEEVLKKAEQYLLLSGEDTSSLVDRLNELAVDKEREIVALQTETTAYRERRKALTDRFTKEREALFTQVQEQARGVLAQWQSSRIGHKQALKELSKIRGELLTQEEGGERIEEKKEVDMSTLQPGGRVKHIPWKKTATILEVDPRKKRVRLDLSGVSLWADVKDIALEHFGQKSVSLPITSQSLTKSAQPSDILPLHLDLRGMHADVAINELAKFLDAAILQGRFQVEVVHGRGTGVLRKKLHAFLQGFAPVAGFRLAPEDQGGDGMTIVELR